MKLKSKKNGRGSLIKSLTKMKKGVEKYFNSSAEERMLHECIQMVLGKHPLNKLHGIRADLEMRMIKQYSKEYLKK